VVVFCDHVAGHSVFFFKSRINRGASNCWRKILHHAASEDEFFRVSVCAWSAAILLPYSLRAVTRQMKCTHTHTNTHTVACRLNATTAAIIIPIKANCSKRAAGAWSCVFTPGSLLFAAHTCSDASYRRHPKLVTAKTSTRQVELLVYRKLTVATKN
jgi:hypothetical protein